MRVGVWCAAALALFALGGALRPSQVEGESRTSRRLLTPSASEAIDEGETENSVPVFRQKASRRRDDVTPKDSVRTRSRIRPTAPSAPEVENPQPETISSERSNTRRTFSRTRNRLTENETTSQRTTASRENFRSRFRTTTRDSVAYTTFSTTDTPTISDQIETVKVNNIETTKLPLTGQGVSRFDFRSRNPLPSILENSVPRVVIHGRLSPDLGGFPSTTIPTIIEKESTTVRLIDDARTSRRLRYKPRLADTDLNLTGPGTTILDESTKSSQNSITTSQLVPKSTMQPIVVDTIAQSSTEINIANPTTVKITRGLKRPRSRPKLNYNNSSVSKIKSQDEVSEDDNYPASFKALLQARNSSTHLNSSLKDGLLEKASQKIYNTFTPTQNTSTIEGKKFTRYRKQTLEGITNDTVNGEPVTESGSVTEIPSSKKFEYRSRGKYNFRNQKFGSSTTPLSVSSSERQLNKYNRKNKVSTDSPSFDNDRKQNDIRKFPARQTYSSRKRVYKNEFTSSEASVPLHNKDDQKRKLSRTSYYARRNNITIVDDSSTAESSKEEIINTTPSDNHTKSLSDDPVIFAIIPKSENDTKKDSTNVLFESEKNVNESKIFLITVNSKELEENNTSNEVVSNAEESENRLVYNPSSATPRYHASYKEAQNNGAEGEFINTPSSAPEIKNIQSRKYGRKFSKPKENEEKSYTSPKPRPRHSRKFAESFSKTTEASTNGIQIEPEKVKLKYSSKYRSSNLNKPYYKATVPSVTSSTAWLKFFVSDQQLTKSLEEPKRFNGQDINSTTTETLSNQNTTPSPITHESSFQLVEGEETQLGPDMNAISFTQTRSPLSSADLRLSESLVKSSHVMNVEASNHSPSVTVSIFDALAEILTSTQRTRLSTTEVPQIQNTVDAMQSLNGVSNNFNVNNKSGLAIQDTIMSTISNVNTVNNQFVQITEQTTPTAINSLSVVETVTPSQNIERRITIPGTSIIPTFTPTTPVSARRPFAIRILYSETDPPTDKPLTTSGPTSPQPSTGNPTMVLNPVSDILLNNNNIVSSELTSMLSNNIQSIIQNMDDKTRSKISVDMVKLLNSLIPKAVDGILTSENDFDSFPNTTPYSLKEIMDTQNIDSSNRTQDESIYNVTDFPQISSTIINDVDSFIQNNDSLTSIIEVFQNVNSFNTSLGTKNSTASVFSSQRAEKKISLEIDNILRNRDLPITEKPEISDELNTSAIVVVDTNSFSYRDSENVSTTNLNTTLTPLKVPSKNEILNNSQTVNRRTLKPDGIPQRHPKNIDNFDIQGNQVSPLQLWILSRKARVLKMIEELLLEHNNELATAAPLTELLNGPNNLPVSQRLTEIMNTMNLMTTDSNDQLDSTSPISFSYEPSSTNSPEREIFTNDVDFQRILSETTTKQSETFTTENIFELQGRNAPSVGTNSLGSSDFQELNSFSTNLEELTTTSTFDTTSIIAEPGAVETSTQNNDEITLSTIINENTNELTETNSNDPENLKFDIKSTTKLTATDKKIKEMMMDTTPSDFSTISIIPKENVATQLAIPKKDYVIFGILPNNTVVRKDPNDDPLASLTEATPFIVYGVLPNNTIIRKFPNGTRVPRVMQKIDIIPISPWSLRNPYSPIHNNPAIVRPQFNPIRVSTNETTTDDINNGTENQLTNNTIVFSSSSAHEDWEKPVVTSTNMPTSIPNINGNSFDVTTTVINRLPVEKSTASHVLSLRTTTMLPSVDEILLNSLSSAAKEEMVISSMTTSTYESRILTLDIDPETKQIRTEKPGDGNGAAVFRFIPIDEVTTLPQDSNVLKLASTKYPITTSTGRPDVQTVTATSFPESSQILAQDIITDTTITPKEIVSTVTQTIDDKVTQSYTDSSSVGITDTTAPTLTTILATTAFITTVEAPTITTPPTMTTTERTITPQPTTTTTVRIASTPETPITTILAPTTTFTSLTTQVATTSTELPPKATTNQMPLTTQVFTTRNDGDLTKNQEDIKLLASFLQVGERSGKSLILSTNNQLNPTSAIPMTNRMQSKVSQDNQALLQALLTAAQNPSTLAVSKNSETSKVLSKIPSTTFRSIEDDIRQFEEDTKLLKALLQATGQDPAKFNIPSISNIQASSKLTTIPTPLTKPELTTLRPTTTIQPTTTRSTTPPVIDEITKYQEDAKLLQALLQSSLKLERNKKIPIISGITSNVRVNSNPLTTSIFTNPTTPISLRPIYTSRTTTPMTPVFSTTNSPNTISVTNILQSRQPTTTEAENVRISTTFSPITPATVKIPTTTRSLPTILSGRKVPSFDSTTEVPSTSTFSVEEDIMFLQNLKAVLGKTDSSNNDPESTLANRIIALAVERSLNEIQSDKQSDSQRTGKAIAKSVNNRIPTTSSTTTTTTTTTTSTTTTTHRPTTTVKQSTPSIDDDIRQFQQDTKLLQALLKATGQDPSKFNIPTLNANNAKVSSKVPPAIDADLQLLSNLLASPSPLNEPFDSLTKKPLATPHVNVPITIRTTAKPFGAKIAVKDDLNTVQDDAKLLQTLIQLQDVQESTTQKSKLAITGQTTDEVLKKLIQQKPTGMVSEATKASGTLSTEYGKSNDALLAALLKEQGFGPTTASSLDEQIKLAALLNQVVVTPKGRRTTTTTTPPPPPAPRRPILDGLAWLWQQWRETAPGPTVARPSRRPASAPAPATSSTATSNRVNWFGSGPFVGNADDKPSSNRIPLEPPRVVVTEQTDGRGQLVSAAINVTRAFSQFLGAAIQGAAQTVQNVIKAGQRAASDVYMSGSGSG